MIEEDDSEDTWPQANNLQLTLSIVDVVVVEFLKDKKDFYVQ